MRSSVCHRASLLLQHIHRSLPALQRLYAHPQPPHDRSGLSVSSDSLEPATSSARRAFPLDPQSQEEGDAVVKFFCEELGMGETPLRLWRQKLKQRMRQRWREEEESSCGTARSREAMELPWTRVRAPSRSPLQLPAAKQKQQSASTLWLRPRAQDVAVVQSAIRNLKFLVSPLLLLSPPPYVSTQAPETSPPPAVDQQHRQRLRPTSYEECSRWYAIQPIPAGMFLMSLPTEAVLFANPPPASDPLLHFFMQVEELVAQLVDAAVTEGAAHHGYASYLCDSVVPSRNLPFLSAADLQTEFSLEDAAKRRLGPGSDASNRQQHGPLLPGSAEGTTRDNGDGGSEEAASDSPAISLLSFFHEDMSGEPLSDYLRARLSKEEYAWWVSLVLSHRTGSSSLLPMIDKLNHSPLPNCYYTMATAETVCGLDVLDNLFAGVPEELLYQPYIHLFAIRDIQAGEELTLCYASAAEGAYRPAGVHPPARPASLQIPAAAYQQLPTERIGGSKENSQRPEQPTKSISDVLKSMFSSSAVAAAATAAVTGLRSDLDKAGLSGELRHLQHPGRQEVCTAEGCASWRLQWGFVPACDAVYSAKDLMEMAALVAERRVDTRTALFPPPHPSATPVAAGMPAAPPRVGG
ncbi:hypothetical protein ABL78_5464 [Leptomonas seymouri]|uniref:SET domain-containing protein n=1 Tax=Leptomonas seymouri TaxID=5684 RepID=A0A0N1IJT8_LEPSE|nr:hypothetical protein ABL78_5464 [Leptomonas seymouri]|eukprot:KPI85471.1 hypothetical protein ABL78_5464 [Leptomonas seymouri]